MSLHARTQCNLLWVLCLLWLLTGCGFQLRGAALLPAALHPVRLEFSDAYSPLRRDLQAALRRSGAEIASAGQDAARILVLWQEMRSEAVSYNRIARVQEYEMVYRIDLEVRDARDAILLPKTRIELRRGYVFDETQALGIKAQEDLLRHELQRDMVQQVLRRLSAIPG